MDFTHDCGVWEWFCALNVIIFSRGSSCGNVFGQRILDCQVVANNERRSWKSEGQSFSGCTYFLQGKSVDLVMLQIHYHVESYSA